MSRTVTRVVGDLNNPFRRNGQVPDEGTRQAAELATGVPRAAVKLPSLLEVAARRLKVTPQTIARWLASGRLTGQRIGCILVVNEAAVAELESCGGER